MIEKLTEEELNFLDVFYDSVAMAECLFSDYDNLAVMIEEDLSHVRLGQIPLLSHEHMIDEQEDLSEKENFKLKKGAGELYCLGGRLFGKTLFVEKIDMLVDMVIADGGRVGFSSYDAIHIRGVLEEIIQCLDHHPFYRILNPNVNRSPSYRIGLRTGYLCEGVNMNITGKKPGAQFFQKHFTKLYIEEASFETDQIYKQRRDSVSENGCIFRVAGMTNFTKYSPCGQKFYDLSMGSKILNLPQYINPKWDDKAKAQAIKDFGGEQSVGYRVFIKGEVVEEGVSVFDMERIRKNYFEKRKIKMFEVAKEQFHYFESTLSPIERPTNADYVYLFADIGESAPSEIGIVFDIKQKYRYVYNITLYNLTDKEQFRVFRWLGEKLQVNFLALDTTDGMGRAIFRSLEEVFPKENLIWVHFGEKLPVGFEKDDKGNQIFKSGQPIHKEEYVSEWSIKHLKDLLYSDRMELPLDYKFDLQFNSVIAMQSGTRTVYSCVAQENHLFQAFQVFSIAQWYCEFQLISPVRKKTFFKSGV